jgi:hypothetical protein
MGFPKTAPRHVTLNLCFYIRWDLWVMWCIMVHPGREMSMHYFSCLDAPGAVSIKSAPGHVTPNMRFASGGICGSHCAFQGIRGMKYRCTIFHAQVGLVRFPKKACRDMLG